MRQILMSKQNEFTYNKGNDQIRSIAVKMFAKVIGKSNYSSDKSSDVVVVSNKISDDNK
jgi:hypothetical protein